MGDMFRSEEMGLCQMFIQPEAAYASIAELGQTGCVQFRDLNGEVNAFQRRFVTEVRRCDELERKIRYLNTELKKDEIRLCELPDDDIPEPPNPREIVDLEAQLESIESEVKELAQNAITLNTNFLGLSELKHVLENTEGVFSDQENLNFDTTRFIDQNDPNIIQMGQRGQLGFVAGVIKLERFFAFERMLWRISHGNVFVRRSDVNGMIMDIETGKPTLKTVFVAFFQGDQLKQRIKKVCDGFHASTYPCPSAHNERQAMIKDVTVRIEDLKLVLNQTADHRSRVLVAASRNLPKWSVMIKKMKAIYHTLNCFNMDLSNRCLIGEGWVPTQDLPKVQAALARGSAKAKSSVPSFLNVIQSNEQPPTFTRANKFTRGFQNLIDSYGMASYREVNPALYTVITFPFLFAVMFGDMGHGVILLLVGLFLVLREKELSKIKEEIFNIFFGGRYIILLMGIFSMYTGFIYNDVFSKSMNIFGSAWHVRFNVSTVEENIRFGLQLNPRHHVNGTYPMGVDPVWQLADNKIIFLNTYKMKLSIIFGVVHMIFGVCMSFINFNFFKKRVRILLEFLPQILFLTLLFGYMVFMMFFKWVNYSGKATRPDLKPGCAPSILILFINMMLFKHNAPLPSCEEYMFEGQESLQMGFIAVALVCIPWMLLGMPIYIKIQRNRKAKMMVHANGNTTDVAPQTSAPVAGGHGHDDEPMGEVFIQQAIHTIEYVLSTISHTASYLRLWALSLAHAQLSEVLWNMIFARGFVIFNNYIGSILVYLLFWPWSTLTIFILVLIEGLSAFLHTLRLHWVEFMSKFYEGLGYPFTPFDFKTIMEATDDD